MTNPSRAIVEYLAKLQAEQEAEKRQPEWTNLFFQALGMAVTVWASLELVLDLNIHVIATHYGGKSITEKAPKQLERKLEYLTKAFIKLPSLAQFLDQASGDLAKIERMGKDRHRLIHGAALVFLGPNAQSYKFDFSLKTEHRLAKRDVSLDEIRAFTTQANQLINSQIALGQTMRAPFPGSTIKDA